MNKISTIYIIIFLFVLGFVFIVIYHGFKLYNEKNYQISMKGIFILTNQNILLKRINNLSKVTGNKQFFMSKINKLLSLEPYIKSFTVRYAWPNKIIINIEEITPVAIIKKYGFLTSECKLIKYENLSFENIYFFELNDVILNEFFCKKIMNIQNYLDKRIKLITLLSNGDYKLKINNTEYIINDNFDEMFTKIWRIHKNLQKKNITNLIFLDLRYLSGSAIKTTLVF